MKGKKLAKIGWKLSATPKLRLVFPNQIWIISQAILRKVQSVSESEPIHRSLSLMRRAWVRLTHTKLPKSEEQAREADDGDDDEEQEFSNHPL